MNDDDVMIEVFISLRRNGDLIYMAGKCDDVDSNIADTLVLGMLARAAKLIEDERKK